jgi:hypothetical protein
MCRRALRHSIRGLVWDWVRRSLRDMGGAVLKTQPDRGDIAPDSLTIPTVNHTPPPPHSAPNPSLHASQPYRRTSSFPPAGRWRWSKGLVLPILREDLWRWRRREDGFVLAKTSRVFVFTRLVSSLRLFLLFSLRDGQSLTFNPQTIYILVVYADIHPIPYSQNGQLLPLPTP